MKMIRRLVVRGALVLAAVAVIGAVGLWLYLDWLTQAAVQRGVTYATDTATTVEQASLAPWAGRLGVERVTVANPKLKGEAQFQSSHFLSLSRGTFELDWSTAFTETVRTPKLVVNALHQQLTRQRVHYYHGIILERLEQLGGEQRPADARKFVIDSIRIKNVSVTLHGYPGGRRTVELSQPIELKNVGSDTEKGVIVGEVTGVIIQAVLKSLLTDITGLPKDLTGKLEGMLEQLNSLDKLGEQLLNGASQVLPGLSDLFGNQDDKSKNGQNQQKREGAR
jgi:Tfp pilus assembly major pilin PilA